MTLAKPKISWLRAAIAIVGAQFIYFLIWVFGRTYRRDDIGWLIGPLGGPVIGDATYEEVAASEHLTVERNAKAGGLIPRFEQLAGDGFDVAQIHAGVRDFYEHTAEFDMDVWSRAHFPASIALALLVATISRQVNQLNFPLSPLETALGMRSEIITMRAADGTVKYSGWLRTLASDAARVLYTGFYMTASVPGEPAPCVKAVFPMPNGNATVVLHPSIDASGALVLDSGGRGFGGAGFYRVQRRDAERVRVWRIATLKEHFRVYVDPTGALRCDHRIRFLGMPVLSLHYKMSRS